MQYTHWQRHTQKMTWEDNEGLFLCLKLCLVPDWGQYQDITLQMLICVMVKLSSAKFRPHPGFWLRDEKLHATYSEKRRGKKWGSTGDPSKLKRHPRTPVLLLFQHSFPVKHLRVYISWHMNTSTLLTKSMRGILIAKLTWMESIFMEPQTNYDNCLGSYI